MTEYMESVVDQNDHFAERELSGRVLDSRQMCRGFDPHRCHCVVSLNKTNLSLVFTVPVQEGPSQHN